MSTESHASPPPRPCRKCGSIAFRTEGVTFKDGTEHIKRICLECESFIDYAMKEMPEEMFVMPFGKYKGLSLAQLVEQDAAYARWLLREKKGSSIAIRIKIILKRKNP